MNESPTGYTIYLICISSYIFGFFFKEFWFEKEKQKSE